MLADDVNKATHLCSYVSQRLCVVAPLTLLISSDSEPLKVLLWSSGSRNHQSSNQEHHCVAEQGDKPQLPSIHTGAYPSYHRLNEHNQQRGLNTEELYMWHHETGSQRRSAFDALKWAIVQKKKDDKVEGLLLGLPAGSHTTSLVPIWTTAVAFHLLILPNHN